mmetsp:Transcript_15604/g.19004  ORF Transcript_15604/g.19004 Transcript_15604/m.19004 type:complete len:134 (-) Transcript_15604:43-444(-)
MRTSLAGGTHDGSTRLRFMMKTVVDRKMKMAVVSNSSGLDRMYSSFNVDDAPFATGTVVVNPAIQSCNSGWVATILFKVPDPKVSNPAGSALSTTPNEHPHLNPILTGLGTYPTILPTPKHAIAILATPTQIE